MKFPFSHIIFTLVHISYLYYTFNQGLGHQPAWYSVRSSEWERLPWTNLLFKQKVTKTLKEKVQSQQTHNTILTKKCTFLLFKFLHLCHLYNMTLRCTPVRRNSQIIFHFFLPSSKQPLQRSSHYSLTQIIIKKFFREVLWKIFALLLPLWLHTAILFDGCYYYVSGAICTAFYTKMAACCELCRNTIFIVIVMSLSHRRHHIIISSE